MLSVLRSVLSIVAGFVVASIVMMLLESVNGKFLFPGLAESAQGVADRERLREILADAPVGAFLVVIVGWILAGIAGGFTAAKIAGKAKVLHSSVLGVLLTLAGVANNLMIPPPIWFWAASLVVLFPAAFFGGRLAAPRAETQGQ
jgi:hypothetical protein